MKTSASVLASNRRWREKNREKHLAAARAYHYKHRDRLLARKREHLKENNAVINARRRFLKWGITPDEFEMMLATQAGACAICMKVRKLVVDHDHKTGAIRSLLCSPCNTAFGLVEEDPSVLTRMIEYAAMMKAQAAQVKAGIGAPQQGQPQQ